MVTGRSPGKHKDGRPIKAAPPFKRTIPTKPEGLGEDGSKLWDMVTEELPRVDLLKNLDGPSLEIACRTLDRWREAVRLRQEYGLTNETSQGPGVAPWIRIEEAASREFKTWCQEYGMTPAAELKLSTQNVDPNATGQDNPFG
jgi:P27 family predicted phage terminase small subunit